MHNTNTMAALREAANKPLALSLKQAADSITMSADWLRRQCRAGKFPHIRCGRRLLFRAQAIDNWLRERERAALKEPD